MFFSTMGRVSFGAGLRILFLCTVPVLPENFLRYQSVRCALDTLADLHSAVTFTNRQSRKQLALLCCCKTRVSPFVNVDHGKLCFQRTARDLIDHRNFKK